MNEQKEITGFYGTNKNNPEDTKYTEDLQSMKKQTNSKSYTNKTSYHLK